MNVFHIAIPTHDLSLAQGFYYGRLGAERARLYDDRVTFRFFDFQIVCHLAPDNIPLNAEVYPRHFGLTFEYAADFDTFIERLQEDDGPHDFEVTARFGDLPERHRTVFLVDPSNNVLEFKNYQDHKYAY